jgi:hypothetical protein
MCKQSVRARRPSCEGVLTTISCSATVGICSIRLNEACKRTAASQLWDNRLWDDTAISYSRLHVGRRNCEVCLLAQTLRAGVAGGLGWVHFQAIAPERGWIDSENHQCRTDRRSWYVSVQNRLQVERNAWGCERADCRGASRSHWHKTK